MAPRVPAHEKGAQRAVSGDDALSSGAQRDEIVRAVEPIVKACEGLSMLVRIERCDESRGRPPQTLERKLDPGAEQVHAAVPHTGSQEPDNLAVGGIRKAERIPNGVLIGPGHPVRFTVQALERDLEPET